jgi:hypothetical protein
MTPSKDCAACGKRFHKGKWDLGKKWVERRACCRHCGTILGRQAREARKVDRPIGKFFRCGRCGQRHEGRHACTAIVPILPWEAYV